jgi:hypothetical protein
MLQYQLDRAINDATAKRGEAKFDKDDPLYKLIEPLARQSEDERESFEASREAPAELAKRLRYNPTAAPKRTAAAEQPFVEVSRVPDQAKPACEFITKAAIHLLANGVEPKVVLEELARTATHFGAPVVACNFILTMAHRATGIAPEHFIAALIRTAIHFDVPEGHFPRPMVQRGANWNRRMHPEKAVNKKQIREHICGILRRAKENSS